MTDIIEVVTTLEIVELTLAGMGPPGVDGVDGVAAAHRSTHGVGGSDALTAADLGTGTADASTFLRGDKVWAAPAGGIPLWPTYAINRYTYLAPDANLNTAPTKDREYATLFIVNKVITLDQIGFWHRGAAGDAAAIARCGIRNDDEGQPGSVRWQGSYDLTTGSGAWKFLNPNHTLGPGVYWGCIVAQGWNATAPILQHAGGGNPPFGLFAAATINAAGIAAGHNPGVAVQNGITGALPDTFNNANIGANTNFPLMSIRRSA